METGSDIVLFFCPLSKSSLFIGEYLVILIHLPTLNTNSSQKSPVLAMFLDAKEFETGNLGGDLFYFLVLYLSDSDI